MNKKAFPLLFFLFYFFLKTFQFVVRSKQTFLLLKTRVCSLIQINNLFIRNDVIDPRPRAQRKRKNPNWTKKFDFPSTSLQKRIPISVFFAKCVEFLVFIRAKPKSHRNYGESYTYDSPFLFFSCFLLRVAYTSQIASLCIGAAA